ncbi:neuritin 1-like b [Gymnodraco acuticeps]|uniref:Neuritin 1-like b n=1 Tax=Gymnodraco acuticeps TaxID=8218 RepID=A0A6P8SPZ0_GYMAC|nr:neuritin 1-like b [Gymnodraco acuticeps]
MAVGETLTWDAAILRGGSGLLDSQILWGASHQRLGFRGGSQIHRTRGREDEEVPTRHSDYAAAHRSLPQGFQPSQLFFFSPSGLVPVSFGAAISCASIYKSFAQCLLTLGDSLVETQKDQNTQDIDAICRSWNAFHVCANSALAGCPGDAAAVWESLRQESRKTQFSGNLYDMCASRTTLPPSTVPAAPSPPTSDQTNKETLKGQTNRNSPPFSSLMFPVCSTLLLLLRS